MSTVDYGLIAIIAFASSFFGAFGKELADLLIKWVRNGRVVRHLNESDP